MNEAVLSSVGQALRDARDAQGFTLDEVAARLRLMHRQIEAMEADDFESLGQPVFARGFVRNYARLLGLDADALLARMQGAPAEPTVVSRAELPAQRSWLTSPWLILLLLGLLAMAAVPVGLYLWLNSEVDDVPPAQTAAAMSQYPAATGAQKAATVPEAPVAADLAAPAAETVPDKSTDPQAAVRAPEAVQPAADVAPPAALPAPAPTIANGVLHLEFGAEAWAEIKDASGRMLLRQLNSPGSSVDVRGQPPFEVVIGNAAQARMTYNGRPIDLKPFIDVTVARFTLEE